MTSGSITPWQIDGEKVETVTDFIFLGSKITVDDDADFKLKDSCSLEEKLGQTGPASSFSLELFLHSFPVAYWIPTDLDRGRGLIFQCHIFLPFHTVHGVLKAIILEWFAIPFSSGPRFVIRRFN